MKLTQPEINTFVVMEYKSEIAHGIGRLMPQLSPNFTDEPMSRVDMEERIASPYHDLLVAESRRGQIIGSAAISVVLGTGHRGPINVNRFGWLEDFVVDEEFRGLRNWDGFTTADLLWWLMKDWCKAKSLPTLKFGSDPSREAAYRFYTKKGAVIEEGTDTFKVDVPLGLCGD